MAISDDDLNLSVTEEDRGQARSGQVSAGPVRGVGAIKGIFNAENKVRLIFMGGVAFLLVSALLYTYFSFTPDEVVGNSAVSAQKAFTNKAQAPSQLVREEAERYNQEGLTEAKKDDPTAHPIVVLGAEEDQPVDPFKKQEEFKRPKKISETGQTQSTGGSSSNAGAPKDFNAMDAVIGKLIKEEGESGPELYAVDWDYADDAGDQGSMSLAAGGDAIDSETGGVKCQNPATRAATMYMATADIALNSDVGGPVSLTIRNGRLRGAQLIGEFERKEEWLRMELNKLVTDNHTMPVNAIGLDMDTTLNAVQGEVDSHILYRYGWWGVGTVLKAIGKAAEANADSEIVVSDGTALESTKSDSSRELKMAVGSLGEDLGSVMQDRINRPITVSLKVNDEVGIYFLDDVCLPDEAMF